VHCKTNNLPGAPEDYTVVSKRTALGNIREVVVVVLMRLMMIMMMTTVAAATTTY
jgi:hypothetical protein